MIPMQAITTNPPVLMFNISSAIEYFNNVIATLNPHTRVWFFSTANKKEFIASLLNAMFDGTDLTVSMQPCITLLAGMGIDGQVGAQVCHEFANQVYKCLGMAMPTVSLDPSLYHVQKFQYDMLTIAIRAVAAPTVYQPIARPQ